MRKLDFFVASEIAADFADALAESELENSITGVSDEGELIIEVQYERNEVNQVEELEELLERLNENLENEEEEDDD